MGAYKILDAILLTADGLTHIGVTDIQRYTGTAPANQLFKQIRLACPAPCQILQTNFHPESAPNWTNCLRLPTVASQDRGSVETWPRPM